MSYLAVFIGTFCPWVALSGLISLSGLMGFVTSVVLVIFVAPIVSISMIVPIVMIGATRNDTF